ncbi:unnamed protein product [Mytilus coruscus]|uniref:B box-type domain-containing protein n=1 Tax=Mytilus coruscus TaxID=42192 RepID=A0A6J8AIH9_MYTCO|nr:unnamed protein product [Mytilus coruscus]
MDVDKFCSGCLRDQEQNAAAAWCLDCKEDVCEACAKAHRRINPPHKVMPLDDEYAKGPSFTHMMQFCDVHTDQKFVQFCTQHNQIICECCLKEDHVNCNSVTSIESFSKESENGTWIKELQREMINLDGDLHIMMKIQTEMIPKLKEQKKEILKQLSAVRQQIDAHLNTIENKLINDLSKKYNTCKGKVEQSNHNTAKRRSDLQCWTKNLTKIEESRDEVQIFQAIKVFDRKVQREKSSMNKSQQISIEFHTPDINELLKNFIGFGEISVIECINLELQQALKHDQSFNESEKSNVSDSSLREGNFKCINAFSTPIFGTDVEIERGCFITNNRLLLLDIDQPYLYVCSFDGSGVETIKVDQKPWDVALIDTVNAIITFQNKGYRILDLTTLTLGQYFKPEAPGCYAVTSSQGQIWIDTGSFAIIQIDINGNVLRTLTTKHEIKSICSNDTGNIYYVSNEVQNDRIYCIKAEGEETIFYDSPDLRWPSDITLDNKGNVYVAGGVSNNVHKISPDGKRHEIVLSKEDGVYSSCGMCYNKERKTIFVISDYGNNIVTYK